MVLFIVLSGVMGIVYAPMRNAGTRQRKKRKPMEPLDGAMAADLLQAALKAGTSIPGALIALDVALGEEEESAGLQVVGRLLVMGATWDEAWNDVPARFDMLRDALQPAWEDGAAPCLSWSVARRCCGRVENVRRERPPPDWDRSLFYRWGCASCPRLS